VLIHKRTQEDKILKSTIRGILGRSPSNLELFKLSVKHSSSSSESNERLEYLGDAILGAIVAEYLFKKFPRRDEGFLTEIRSRIVKRESLNSLAIRIGLSKLVLFSNSNLNNNKSKSIYGNALEAFIGAVYLDKGYDFCTKFILDRLINPHISIEDTIKSDTNFKSKLIEWCQKASKDISFELIKEEGSHHKKIFTIQVLIDAEVVTYATGHTKKKAEQAAAEKCCEHFNI
jgi:ribonuclease III